ncbi:MAG TPA: response regulator [Chthonomonadaceae bacterium]|nr:response regulator [Chthonomonadaceae bacterium]
MARILVVDDENNIRTMMRLALQYVGHTVETASDGPEGLDKFGDGSGCDLVLLDQRMPGMEGLEVLREMRQRDPKARIIMVTAFGTIDLAVDAIKAGATDFLRKPFTAEVLRGAVQSALQEAQPSVSPTGVTFGFTTINGYRIEYQVDSGEHADGGFRQEFTVCDPGGQCQTCVVVLPAYIIELVKAHTDREQMPGGDRFWQALCEEALANYLWQNAEFPAGGQLRVEELTTGLRRFMDTVLAA